MRIPNALSRVALAVALSSASLSSAVLAAGATAGSARAEQPLFVVVTSGEPQVQGMAMVLSMQALQRGTPVRMLLCGPGGDLALQDHSGPALQPSGRTPQQMMQGAMQAGAEVQVCALYLPNSGGRTQADLLPGVSAAAPPAVGEFMARPEVRYFTF